MSDIVVCRVCLANNIRMQSIFKTQYHKMFEILTGLKLIAGDGRPDTVCFVCTWQLQRFYKFYKMAHNAERALAELYHNGIELTQWTVSRLAGVSINNLTVTPVDNTTVPESQAISEDSRFTATTNSENDEVQVAVKVEPIDYEGNEDIFIDVANSVVQSTEHLIEIDSDPVYDSENVQNIKAENPVNTVKSPEPNDCNEAVGNSKNSDFTCTNPKVMLERIPMDKLSQIAHPEQKSHAVIEFDFYCEQCPYKSSTASVLLKHSLVHDPTRAYGCRACSYRYKCVRSLRRHWVTTHAGRIMPTTSPRYVCRVCGAKFLKLSKYKSHSLKHNNDEYHCERCDRKFIYKNTYDVHMRTHTGEKPFECTHCDKTFNCKSNRRKHMKTHTGDKPYDCSRCGRQFSQKTSMIMHMRNTCIGILECRVCGKRYERTPAFKKHVKTHQHENREKISKKTNDIGEKRDDQFTCEMCQLVFDKKSLLQQHVVEHIL